MNDARAPERGETTLLLAHIAASAPRYCRGDANEQRTLGARVLGVLVTGRASIERWWRDDDADVVDGRSQLASHVEAPQVALVETIRALPFPSRATRARRA